MECIENQWESMKINENGALGAPPGGPGSKNAYDVCVILHSGAIDPKCMEISENYELPHFFHFGAKVASQNT